MDILTTIPDSAIPAWQAAVDKYNAGSNSPPVSIEVFAQIFRDEETARYMSEKDAAERAEMAANEQLMALGRAVMQQPGKLPAVVVAVTTILES
jgi:hypothetical protein